MIPTTGGDQSLQKVMLKEAPDTLAARMPKGREESEKEGTPSSSSSSSSSSTNASFSLARTPQLRLPDVPRPQACPDTSRCPAVGTTRRVFLIEGGKEDGAFAQTFYQIVVNGVLHAWRENMVPLVKFSPHRVAKTLGTDWWRRRGCRPR